MKYRIYNVNILTMEEGRPIFSGEMHVEEDRIVYVGPKPRKKKSKVRYWDREIDGKGSLLMPGFKNAHTHSAMTFLRSYADDLPLDEWLGKMVFPAEAKLTPDDIYWLSKLAVLEYLSGGITANMDMYLDQEALLSASSEMGFRTVSVGNLNNFSSSLREMEDCYHKYGQKDGLVSYHLGFHAEYTTSKELLEGVGELAVKYQAPVFTHNSETQKEVKECQQRYGMTPTELFDSLHIYDYGGGGYHCIWLSEEDRRIFKERGLSVVSCPASNAKLASGIAPLHEYKKDGINLALGTDGPASNNGLDLFREMYLAAVLPKLLTEDAACMDAVWVLKAATMGGAKAMGLKESDILAKGKKADFILLDLYQPNMQPVNQIEKNLVYSGNRENVWMSAVDGKILYEKGNYNVGEDPELIYKKANQICKRIK
ncbi:MAG: amidohydrolase [Lachnospiraceae bacterium]|nr:amidohydrolase [Lachnospiraceae bacterium]